MAEVKTQRKFVEIVTYHLAMRRCQLKLIEIADTFRRNSQIQGGPYIN